MDSAQPRPAHTLRVEKDLSASWTGVHSCGDSDTVKANMSVAYDAWLKKVTATHHGDVVGYGIVGEATVRTNFWNEPFPSNARRCSGNVKMSGYVDFDAD